MLIIDWDSKIIRKHRLNQKLLRTKKDIMISTGNYHITLNWLIDGEIKCKHGLSLQLNMMGCKIKKLEASILNTILYKLLILYGKDVDLEF